MTEEKKEEKKEEKQPESKSGKEGKKEEETKPEPKETKETKETKDQPPQKEMPKKKVNKMTLEEIEIKLKEVEEKMGGLDSLYAKHLLRRKELLSKKENKK